jgi:hypothetical protein
LKVGGAIRKVTLFVNERRISEHDGLSTTVS